MRHRIATAAALALLVAACSDVGSGAQRPTTPTEVATTNATRRPFPNPAATTTTIPATTTTIPVTTTTVEQALPVPKPPPALHANEPGNQLGTLEIPKLQLVRPLLEGISLTTLDKGPGHWPGTAMPGHVGNVVIGGHRTSKDRPFRNIDQLAPGDEVILSTAEGRFVYKVDRTQIVYPDAMWIIDQSRSYSATLFACHPVGSTKQRIVVFLTLQR
ncbi:MAG: class E sortase [Actinomycetota bacterium]|nr:class E sortase [Actinomycetota bacterium]